MRPCKYLLLLALIAGTGPGCATATRRNDGLDSIRAKPRSGIIIPPQRAMAATTTGAGGTSDHAGVFAKPDGLAKFFPGLQKEPAAAAVIAEKPAGRTSWLGRKLRGMGQGTPTSLTYSTAPRATSARRKTDPGEISVLPVALNIPSDHARDQDVTPTLASGDSEAADKADKAARSEKETVSPTPLAPANPESISTDSPSYPTPAPIEPEVPEVPEVPEASPPTTPETDSLAPSLAPSAEPTPTTPTTTDSSTFPGPLTDSPPVAPEPSIPEPKAPEPTLPEPKPPEPAPTPAPAPSPEPDSVLIAPAATPSTDSPVSPSTVAEKVPTATPASSLSPAILPRTDLRERPRLADTRPKAVVRESQKVEPKKAAPTAKPAPVPAPAATLAPSKKIPVAAHSRATAKGDRPDPALAKQSKERDRAVMAVRAQVEATRSLGLPDPTLPASYYRSDVPPVRGDVEVAGLPHAHPKGTVDPGVAQASGACPHCGHDPLWRPSLQRLGRRVLGLGEFAAPPVAHP